jgi:4-amino-4-deoxy-L-arabinose transferase-like glycosyltransferase
LLNYYHDVEVTQMQTRKSIPGFSTVNLVVIGAAVAYFLLHLFHAPGYGLFFDELYTIALSRHLAFGYVDLPPMVPALAALSRAILGDSVFAYHIVPALAGSIALVFVCLIAKEFGGKTFAVALSALAFIAVPTWLALYSIFCYDSIDQLVLTVFLFILVRFLRTGNKRHWILLGLLAGIACMTKMTIIFLGPGFLAALLFSKYRKDLLTPWPWVGASLCLAIVTPYIAWQIAGGWPTLEYWNNYGTIRVYEASLGQYLNNLLVYMNPLLLPLFAAGLYRVFRRIQGSDFAFFGILFLATFVVMFVMHSAARMLVELFVPLIAAGAIFLEEKLTGFRWEKAVKAASAAYLFLALILVAPFTLPIVPAESLAAFTGSANSAFLPIKEFNGGGAGQVAPMLSGRIGWEELVRVVAAVFDSLPPEEQAVAGIYSDGYKPAGAIDQYGPEYGLPHAVSGSLTYYLWGPGFSWEVMLIITNKSNRMAVFFEACELKAFVPYEYSEPVGQPYIYVCRKPKVPAAVIWSSVKEYR